MRSELFKHRYNKTDHPVAFHKADMFAASKKMSVEKAPAADLEDVAEVRPISSAV